MRNDRYVVTKDTRVTNNMQLTAKSRKQKCELKVGVTHAKQRQRRRRGASLDSGDRLVDLERIGDRDAALGAELVKPQAAKRGGNKKRNDRNVVTVAVTKIQTSKWRWLQKYKLQSGGNAPEQRQRHRVV
jgi:hypothetical protein